MLAPPPPPVYDDDDEEEEDSWSTSSRILDPFEEESFLSREKNRAQIARDFFAKEQDSKIYRFFDFIPSLRLSSFFLSWDWGRIIYKNYEAWII